MEILLALLEILILGIVGFVAFCTLIFYLGFTIWSVAILNIRNVWLKLLLCLVSFVITPMIFSVVSIAIAFKNGM